MQLRRVAFLGLGRMGLGMAGRLLDAGYDVTVYNRSAGKVRPLQSRGAQVAATPRAAANGAEAVIAMVADDAASRDLWLGDEGAITAVKPEAFVIECSTLSHGWVKELAAAAAGRGVRYIDCPVTGLPDMAARGALTLLVGADAHDLECAKPYLAPLSERIIHFGPVGCGTAYKLMINLMGAVQIAAAAEGMALAERAGLDLGTVAKAIAMGQAASPQVVRNTERMANDDHEKNVHFTPPLRLKDAEYGIRLAHDLGLSVPFGDTACEMFRALCDLGYEACNESKVIEVARLSGQPRRSDVASSERPGLQPSASCDPLVLDDFASGNFISNLGTSWRGFSDRVMGGVSQESVVVTEIDGRRCLRLSGDVRLDNNGGFVQMAMDLAHEGQVFDASAYEGIVIDVFGNGEMYDLRIRTPECTRPWQSFRQTFAARSEWTTLRIPFSNLQPHRLAAAFDRRRLRRLGFLAIGKAFHADLAVSRVALYR